MDPAATAFDIVEIVRNPLTGFSSVRLFIVEEAIKYLFQLIRCIKQIYEFIKVKKKNSENVFSDFHIIQNCSHNEPDEKLSRSTNLSFLVDQIKLSKPGKRKIFHTAV